jgi:hypothetical protein
MKEIINKLKKEIDLGLESKLDHKSWIALNNELHRELHIEFYWELCNELYWGIKQ